MKSWIRSVMTLGVVTAACALALPAHAEGDKDAKGKKHITGEVVAVDATAKTVTVKNKKNAEKVLTCSDKTKVSTGAKEIAELSDLKAGDKVACTYTEEGDKNICSRISPARAKKDEAPPAAK